MSFDAKGDLYWGFKILVFSTIARLGWHLGGYILGKL